MMKDTSILVGGGGGVVHSESPRVRGRGIMVTLSRAPTVTICDCTEQFQLIPSQRVSKHTLLKPATKPASVVSIQRNETATLASVRSSHTAQTKTTLRGFLAANHIRKQAHTA